MEGGTATALPEPCRPETVCCFYWCLLFSTAGHHGKKPTAEREVKGGNDWEEEILVLMIL